MNIYELTTQYQLLQDALEAGEDVEELVSQIEDAIEVKADGYARVIRNFESDIEGLKKAEADLKEKRERLEKAIVRMKGALQDTMIKTDKRKFKTDLFSFSIVRNGGKDPIILASDIKPEDLPEELKTVKITTTANKEAIRQYIEETGDLTYGSIGERGESLRIK